MLKKLLLTLLVCTGLLTNITYAQEQEEFTIDKAIEYALLNHPSISIANSNITKADVDVKEQTYKMAEANRNTKITLINSTMELDRFLKKKGVYLAQAKMGYKSAELGLTQATEGVKLNVELAFYKYINCKSKLDITINTLSTANGQLNAIQTKLDNGLASQFELLSAKTTFKKASNDYNVAKRNVESAMRNLKYTMNYTDDSEITLKGLLEVPKMPESNPKDMATLAKTNSISVIKSAEQLKVDQLSFDTSKIWYTEKTFKYNQAKYDLEASQFAYQTALNDAENEVYKAYDTMIAGYENLDVMQDNISLNEQLYKINTEKYQLGMITKLELDESFNKLSEMKLQMEDLKYACLNNVHQYEFSYTIGVMTK